MQISRLVALRAACNTRSTCLRQQQARQRRHYASSPSPPKSSTNLLWIAAALGLTGVGSYVALAPRGTSHDAADHAQRKGAAMKEQAKDKGEEMKDKAKSKAEEAHEREKKRDEAMRPKPNPDGEHEKNHAVHAETNERKLRKGKFSGTEFDNHITSHSDDPGKDFEIVEAPKAQGERTK